MVLRWDGVRSLCSVFLGACLVVGVSTPSAAQSSSAPSSLEVDTGGGVTLDLVLVRAGALQQGSPENEEGRNTDETLRSVTIGHDFFIGRTEVTVAQFQRFVEETGYRTEAETGKSGGFGWDGGRLVQRPEFTWRNPGFVQAPTHPVTLVAFGDALAFTGWLSKKGGRTFSLPSEAEWEYAYRAGTSTPYYLTGESNAALGIGWFKVNAANGTQPVAQKAPNALGLYDMGGNVFEWCRDWYGPYAPGPVTDPEVNTAPGGDKPRRVLRGGSWLKDAKNLRGAARYRNDPGSRNADNGFRVTASTEANSGSSPQTTTQNESSATPNPGGSGKSGGSGGLVASALVALVSFGCLMLVVMAIRKSRRPKAMRGAPPGVTYRRVKDGFWLVAPSPLHGSVLHYRANVVGRPVRAAIPIEPSAEGQFVYTGGAPVEVEAEQLVGMTAAQAYAAAMSAEPRRPPARAERGYDESDSDDVDSSPAFRGYPGAY